MGSKLPDTMNPKISVIIPANNEEDYIAKTLHSIKLQSYQNYETIVVSNGHLMIISLLQSNMNLFF